jgi:hypothetical protein
VGRGPLETGLEEEEKIVSLTRGKNPSPREISSISPQNQILFHHNA